MYFSAIKPIKHRFFLSIFQSFVLISTSCFCFLKDPGIRRVLAGWLCCIADTVASRAATTWVVLSKTKANATIASMASRLQLGLLTAVTPVRWKTSFESFQKGSSDGGRLWRKKHFWNKFRYLPCNLLMKSFQRCCMSNVERKSYWQVLQSHKLVNHTWSLNKKRNHLKSCGWQALLCFGVRK